MSVKIYRGDNRTLRVSITDSCGLPVDTTGWTIDFTLRVDDSSPTALVTKSSSNPGEIDAVNEVEGIWDINLLPTDTDQTIGTYSFDVQATTDDVSPKIYTVLKDALQILQDVTR